MGIIEEIEKWGNENCNYQPFDKAICYLIHSQDFVRTGFLEISPTLSARDYKDPKLVVEEIGVDKCIAEIKPFLSRAEQSRAEQSSLILLGQMDNSLDHTLVSANRVYSINGVAPTIPTCCGGGHEPKILVEVEDG